MFSGVKALGQGAIGRHDLVVVEQNVEEFDVTAFVPVDGVVSNKMPGSCKHLRRSEHQFGPPVAQQHPQTGADQQIAIIPQRAFAEHDRGEVARRLDAARTDPVHRLRAAIAGQDWIARGQVLSGSVTGRGGDTCAAREACDGGAAGGVLRVDAAMCRPGVTGRWRCTGQVIVGDAGVRPCIAVAGPRSDRHPKSFRVLAREPTQMGCRWTQDAMRPRSLCRGEPKAASRIYSNHLHLLRIWFQNASKVTESKEKYVLSLRFNGRRVRSSPTRVEFEFSVLPGDVPALLPGPPQSRGQPISEPQNRWMRVQASSSASSEVA